MNIPCWLLIMVILQCISRSVVLSHKKMMIIYKIELYLKKKLDTLWKNVELCNHKINPRKSYYKIEMKRILRGCKSFQK